MSERKSLREFSVTWPVGNRRLIAWGETPRKAVANARRLRRDYWLAGRDPGWLTAREQLRWTRMARRLGLA